MATITLNFSFNLNTSLQYGDVVYYLGNSQDIKEIGPCLSINNNSIVCDVTGDDSELTDTSFIFFGKDGEINTSGILGYYAEVEFVNESDQYAELFAVNSEIFLSSN